MAIVVTNQQFLYTLVYEIKPFQTFYKEFLQKRHELILVPALSRIKKNELLNTVAPLKISLSKPKERGGLER